MKQLKTILFSLPFVLAAVGCSQDELLPDGGKGTGASEGLHEVEVTFNMGTSGGLQTRSITRPVISSDDWQRVTNVRIYVFKGKDKDEQGRPIDKFDPSDDSQYFYLPSINNEKGYLYVPNFADTKKDWDKDDVWGDDANEQENEAYTYSAKLQLGEGYYKFLAVGRDDITETEHNTMVFSDPCLIYPNEYPTEFIKKAENFSEYEDMNYSPEEPDVWTSETPLDKVKFVSSASPCGTELFTACTKQPIQVGTENAGFTTTMELKRAVAGMLLYVYILHENSPIIGTIKYFV